MGATPAIFHAILVFCLCCLGAAEYGVFGHFGVCVGFQGVGAPFCHFGPARDCPRSNKNAHLNEKTRGATHYPQFFLLNLVYIPPDPPFLANLGGYPPDWPKRAKKGPFLAKNGQKMAPLFCGKTVCKFQKTFGLKNPRILGRSLYTRADWAFFAHVFN